MTDFFTWEMLATQAGATIATGLLTQLLKNPLSKIPTRLLSYLASLVVLLAANFFMGTLTVSSGMLLAINAVVVSLASNGGFDVLAGKKIEIVEGELIDMEGSLFDDEEIRELADKISERIRDKE